VPYTLNPNNGDDFIPEEFEVAEKAFIYASDKDRPAAFARYEAALRAKRESGWRLTAEPLPGTGGSHHKPGN
jgi:hypothetical protein